MNELSNERSEFYDTPTEALQRKIEAIAKLTNSAAFIIITLEPDPKGGFHVFYARQKMNQETTAKLMHDAAKKFHEFDEKEKEVKQMLAETEVMRPEWLTDSVIDVAKQILNAKTPNGSYTEALDYLCETAAKASSVIGAEDAIRLFEKFCK